MYVHKLKLRLAKIKARLLLKDGKDRSMEELIDLLAAVYEKLERQKDGENFESRPA
jgi:hypothetical protein